MNSMQAGRKRLAGTLLAGLMILPMAMTAQEAGHDHQAQGHSDPDAHGGHGGHGGHEGHGGHAGQDDHGDHGGHGGHGGHGAHDGHAGHDMGPSVTRGPWSYLDRDNPASYEADRWVMVPMPGIVAGYQFVRTTDESRVCATLDDPRIIVDRATREACRRNPDALPFQGVASVADRDAHGDHGGHAGHPGHGTPMEHGVHNTHDGHGSHEGRGGPGGHEAHEPQGGHGDHGSHGHDHGGHSWKAPPEAVAMDNPVPASRESIRRGETAYQAFCMSCHGAKARGNGPAATRLPTPPADLVAHLNHHTDGDYAWKIRTGNDAMPGFEDVLTDRQVWDVVNYLRSLAPGERTDGRHAH